MNFDISIGYNLIYCWVWPRVLKFEKARKEECAVRSSERQMEVPGFLDSYIRFLDMAPEMYLTLQFTSANA